MNEDKVNHHFLSFVNHKGTLYELDGAKKYPINHGKTTDFTFLNDACVIVKQYMDRDPKSNDFGLICLAPPPMM